MGKQRPTSDEEREAWLDREEKSFLNRNSFDDDFFDEEDIDEELINWDN